MARTLTDEDLAAIARTLSSSPRSIDPNVLYTTKEAALILSVHPAVVQRKLDRGIIKGSKKIGRWRVRGSELLKCG